MELSFINKIPAAYGGHRELDLAMMRLFGGFEERTFAAYDEAFPLAPGHEERVPLYQLYFLLVHLNLFAAVAPRRIVSALAVCIGGFGTGGTTILVSGNGVLAPSLKASSRAGPPCSRGSGSPS